MRNARCDYPLCDAATVEAAVFEAVAARRPFSLVRLGDNEGLIASMGPHATPAQYRRMELFLGPDLALPAVRELQAHLKDAIGTADFVGLRSDIVDVDFPDDFEDWDEVRFLIAFRAAFRLRPVEARDVLAYDPSLRLALLHRWVGRSTFSEGQRFCSAWVHHDLQRSGFFHRLLSSVRRIGLVSSRREVPAAIEARYPALSVHFHSLPPEFRHREPGADGADHRRALDATLDELDVEFPGMVYLVGGGVHGKAYCRLIRAQGGIAIDVGSVPDAWEGAATRPAVYRTMFGLDADVRAVPPELTLGFPGDTSHRETAARTRPAVERGSSLRRLLSMAADVRATHRRRR